MLKLHPKIKVALLAAIGVALLTVGQKVLDVYPDEQWTIYVKLLLPVVAGYFPSSPELSVARAYEISDEHARNAPAV